MAKAYLPFYKNYGIIYICTCVDVPQNPILLAIGIIFTNERYDTSMKKSYIAILMTLVLMISLTACASAQQFGEEADVIKDTNTVAVTEPNDEVELDSTEPKEPRYTVPTVTEELLSLEGHCPEGVGGMVKASGDYFIHYEDPTNLSSGMVVKVEEGTIFEVVGIRYLANTSGDLDPERSAISPIEDLEELGAWLPLDNQRMGIMYIRAEYNGPTYCVAPAFFDEVPHVVYIYDEDTGE